jgi:hypothetical protein
MHAEEESIRLDGGMMGAGIGRCVPQAVERLLVLLSRDLLPQVSGAVRALEEEEMSALSARIGSREEEASTSVWRYSAFVAQHPRSRSISGFCCCGAVRIGFSLVADIFFLILVWKECGCCGWE